MHLSALQRHPAITTLEINLHNNTARHCSEFIEAYIELNRFLPTRRYASAGNRDRNVSVRLSVRPSRAGIVSKEES